MELNNYLKIIIEGLIEVENLKTYFKRLQKVNERDNFITKIEFYTKLTNVTIDLKVKCKERFNESKNELYKVLSLKKDKNEDTKEIEKEIKTITPDMLPLNLMHITNSQFRGTLSYSQIEYVESIILEILKNEKDLINTTKQPQQKETKNPDEVKKERHNNIFKGNAIYLFEKYFNNKSMTFQSRTDFRFLFEQMKKDNLIYNTVTLSQYIKFIGNYGYYETELKAIELDALKNIQRTKDYNEYKDNLKTTLK